MMPATPLRKLLPIALSLLPAFAGAAPLLAPGPAAAQDEKLSADQVRSQMLGKTIRTSRFGVPIRLVYSADGSVVARSFLGTLEGSWEERSGELCTTFEDGPEPGTSCVTFVRTGPNSYRNSDGIAFTVDD